jgi:hypothetical protein
MIANINPETAIRYGVFDPRQCEYGCEFMDEVMSNGTDETWKALEADVKELITELVDTLLDESEFEGLSESEKLEAQRKIVKSNLASYVYMSTTEEADKFVKDYIEPNVDDIYARVMQDIVDYGCDDEMHEYTYDNGSTQYLLTSLGGAPLAYVIKSSHVAFVKECSPCVPNAGDLDSPAKKITDRGVFCYCPPIDEMDDMGMDLPHVFHITDTGEYEPVKGGIEEGD